MKLSLSPAIDTPTLTRPTVGVRGHRSSPDDHDSITDACDARPADQQQQPSTSSIPTDGASIGLVSRPTLHLLLASAILAAVWLLLLPALLHLAPIRSHVDHLDEHRIDASAMYYTELEPEFLIDNRTAGDPK